MAVKLKINGVNITLTKEQLAQIDEQRNKKLTIDDIAGYDNACEILSHIPSNSASWGDQLETIIKAANFIDNNYKIWIPDFSDSSSKYLPYFKRTGLGWSYISYYYWSSHAFCSVGLYYKNSNTAEKFTKKFDELYSKYLG